MSKKDPVVKIGDRFGRLVVESFVDYRGKSKTLKYWKCLCDCGRTSIVFQGSLTRKTGAPPTKSCGCITIERIGALRRLELGESARKVRLSLYKKKARKSKLEFSLSDEEFYSLTQLPCHYCGVPPYRSSITKGSHYYGDFVYNGIDRINSALGYISKNCVPCCRFCNMGKIDSSYEEFIEHLNQIARFRRDTCV